MVVTISDLDLVLEKEVFCIYWQVLQLQVCLLPVSEGLDHRYSAEL